MGLSLSLYVLACFLSSDVAPLQASPATAGGRQEALSGRISELIERLSDSSYSNRLAAQAEIERIGVLALDQLHAASFHPDPQIAATARFVVQSNQFSWSWETDPVNVRQILSNYSSSESDKSVYVDQLARLEHDEGMAALCRLVRYETRSSLAKKAALLLMRSKPRIGQSPASRREAMNNFVGGGQSHASRWLLKYTATEAQFDFPWWKLTLDREAELLLQSSIDTNLELVADVHRWVAEQICNQPTLRPQAIEIGRSILGFGKKVPTLESMLGNRSTHADEFAQWALKVKLPELVQEQHANLLFATVSREFGFGYLLAESFQLQGKGDLATEVAHRSLKQIPCNELGLPREQSEAEGRDPKKSPYELADSRNTSDQRRRFRIAAQLQERGHFDWAEAEYRKSISDDLANDATLEAMAYLSAMLQSQERFGEAAATLKPWVDRYTKEPMFKRQVADWLGVEGVLSNFYLYSGNEAKQAGDLEKAAQEYWLSIDVSMESSRSSPIEDSIPNVDAIIGLYRLPLEGNEAEKRGIRLKKIVDKLRAQIRKYELNVKNSPPNTQASNSLWLAQRCNTLAWVVANTEGSKEEALYLSRRACSLSPESAEYLDTLAYCYAAMDRYQDAVEQQRHAVELKPHHPELTKALKRFEDKLK